jgi:hypothetical protein
MLWFVLDQTFAHVVGSFEKIYVKTKEGALDSYKEGLQVFVWHYRLCNLLPRKDLD